MSKSVLGSYGDEQIMKVIRERDRLKAENERLKLKVNELYERQAYHFLRWRGIDEKIDSVCSRCRGSGVISYSDATTWHGGRIGGQMITQDVCDSCWGSGKDNAPWADLRSIERKLQAAQAGEEE